MMFSGYETRNCWIIGADVNISSREREEIGEERETERGENMRLEREGKWALHASAPPTRHGTWEGIRHGRRLIRGGDGRGRKGGYSIRGK